MGKDNERGVTRLKTDNPSFRLTVQKLLTSLFRDKQRWTSSSSSSSSLRWFNLLLLYPCLYPREFIQFVLPLNSERAISLFYDKHNWLCNQLGEIIIDEEEKGTRIHLDIKLTVFNVSPTIAWRFFERYFDEILSIPWRYNVRTLTWFERNAYDTIVSRKKISWSFSRVFSSGGEHATERSSFKTSCWEHECPFDSSFSGVVKKKKNFRYTIPSLL